MIMEQGKFQKQAEEYAAKVNHKKPLYAGIENNCEYYYLPRAVKGHYLGLPSIIKYTPKGRRIDVVDIAEIFRAFDRV